MNDEVTYSITEKGRAALEGAGKISPSVKKLLELVGGRRTFAELSVCMPEVPEARLREAVEQLVARGYIETERLQTPAAELTLDRPVAAPTVQLRQEAQKPTISGMQDLKRRGYFVTS